MENQNQNKNNFLFTFLAGAAAGAVLGILYAPDKGETTRKKISDQAKDFTDNLEESGSKVMGSLDDIMGRVVNMFSELKGGEWMSAGIDAIWLKGNWNDIKGKLKKKYANLTDEDLNYVSGMENELIGKLQKKLGKTKDDIIDLINNFRSEKQSQH
ncbi:MAG: YtxH domain-containing protein [Bacteroidetes bacterium]|nr:YtxH domain-containing protein [Bacteroidota bacterium]HET6244735.1 YtxH domain-containing protein [Bacteroidia bacterium]